MAFGYNYKNVQQGTNPVIILRCWKYIYSLFSSLSRYFQLRRLDFSSALLLSEGKSFQLLADQYLTLNTDEFLC